MISNLRRLTVSNCCLGLALLLLTCLSSLAAPPAEAGFLLQLHNHPDGSVAPPSYGLRLEGLFTGNQSDVFTFDFEHVDSDMKLLYDSTENSIRIYGDAYGGQVIENAYENNDYLGVYKVDFTYAANVVSTLAWDGSDLTGGLTVTSDHRGKPNMNVGTIESPGDSTIKGGSTIFNLIDEGGPNDTDPSFFLATGHRDFSGHSGWGWLNHVEQNITGNNYAANYADHLPASDWLFTATYLGPPPPPPRGEVPEPGSLAIFGIGVVGCVLVARRRRIKA